MKRCPRCGQIYAEDDVRYCRRDGALLREDHSLPSDAASTMILPGATAADAPRTQLLPGETARADDAPGMFDASADAGMKRRRSNVERRWGRGALLLAALLLLIGAGLGAWVYTSFTEREEQPVVSFQSAQFARLTSTGKASGVCISPDGKYVAHVLDDGGRQSLWMRQVATTSNVQIVPPAEASYRGLTFSPDGNHIYYTVFEREDRSGTLYQVPVLGGATRKLRAGVDSSVTFSPDGRRMAFFRRSIIEGVREDALIVANADGSGEKQLVAGSRDERLFRGSFSGPAWSPDGRLIAYPFGNFVENQMTIAAVATEGGAVKMLTAPRWFAIRQVAWLADGDRLLFTASSNAGEPYQIWQLSSSTGESHRVTNDLNDYRIFSLATNPNALAAVQGEIVSNVWVMPAGDSARAVQLTSELNNNSEVAWMPDGRVIYNSNAGGSVNIFQIEATGGSPKPLTADAQSNGAPTATRDGRYIVFMSDRAGRPNIWRMDADGGNQVRLTDGVDLYPQISPDSRWIVYQSWVGEAKLRKVSIDGGQFEQLTDYVAGRPAISPDGQHIACTYQESTGAPVQFAVIPFAGGPPLKTFPLPREGEIPANLLRWTKDGREVVYARTNGGVSNLWAQPLDGRPPRQITNFTADRIFWFDFSHDGKRIALSRGTQTSDVVLIKDFR
jgi:eukaryotic-like serine/threonine-protein kinase